MGIAQIGKAFRNEITPGNFIFRTREFEQMELEFFCKPGTDLDWFHYWKDFCKNWLLTLGIKEENIRKLFGPLGYKIDDFDASFISTLSSFGALRGETAHTSANKTQQPLDQNTELTRIRDLLVGIEAFENVLNSK